jgi:anti-anti-sigma regulatory factor
MMSTRDEAVEAVNNATPPTERRVLLRGRFDQFRASELLDAVAGEAGQETVLVDMGAVRGLDWWAVNALIQARCRIERDGGQLRLLNVSANTRREIDVMGSTHHLDMTSGPA